MSRWIVRSLGAILLALVFLLPGPVHAQDSTASTGRPTPVFPYVFAVVSTIVILLILCVPTRKA